ncbi:MAG TPA: hypothetical protein GXZ90_02070 [Clostridiales bacterium]|nr:hypothetical protein [Clostridiales bacterium]
MKKIYKADNDLLSYEARMEILKNLGQKDLLKIFDDYKPSYKPIVRKKNPLDQQISLGISKKERENIAKEIKSIKNTGESVTISALVRSRAIGDIDLEEWRERAQKGLKELNSIKWNKYAIEKNLRQSYGLFDEMEESDDESALVLSKKIKEYEAMLEELKRPTIRRSSRMSGRVTFNEANLIRWRAGRLTITVADYMRFLIFGYLPFSENDRHLSVIARKRFYVSILDVINNGWGKPPELEECPNCIRYANENKELREKLERLRKLSR